MKYELPAKYDALAPHQRREVREQYAFEQNGNCYYCGCKLTASPPSHILSKKIRWDIFPPNFLKHPIHLQHDHVSGLTEGAVHAYCNAVMWQYEGR